MHPQSPPLTIDATVTKGVAFDSKMNFEIVARLRFEIVAQPVLKYCSAVWCSADDRHLKLLDRVVSCARFLTGGVLECDVAHCRLVAVLCKLYN